MSSYPVTIDRMTPRRMEAALHDPASPPGRILAAAQRVFAARGYKAATTREIAGQAGVNLATIHYYWGSKDELWYAVMQHVMARIAELTAGLLELPAADLESGIRNIVGKLVDVFADNPDYARLLQHRTMEGVAGEYGKEFSQPILDIGLGFIRKNRIRGFADDFDPALVLFCLQGTLRIFFQEQESVKMIFGENPADFSPAFRQKLKDLISSFALYAAGLTPAKAGKKPSPAPHRDHTRKRSRKK